MASRGDVIYKNDDVYILDPKSERGILIWSISKNKNICKEGLLSYNYLKEKHPELKLPERPEKTDHNDLIFFRAPFRSDTRTFESSYGKKPIDTLLEGETMAIIRVDPMNTFVYSSDLREKPATPKDLAQSRILLDKYLKLIDGYDIKFGPSNLITYVKYTEGAVMKIFPIVDVPIERNTEVVVKLPRIPPEWFVECISKPKKGGKRHTRRKRSKKSKKRARRTLSRR